MITPGKLDLVVQRWTPFVYAIDFEGFDLTGATFAAHVRLYRDAPGAPIIALANDAAGLQGISVTVSVTEGIPTSAVKIQIDETTAEDILLNASGAGKDIVLVWDLHITATGLPKARWLEGNLIIRAGATQNG